MQTKRIFAPIIILIGAFVIFIGLVSMRKPPEKKPVQDARPTVEILNIVKAPYQLTIESQGVTEALNKTNLVSQVSGPVIQFSPKFNAGGFVQKGEALVEIEPFDYQSNVKTAESNLARAKAALEEEEARAKVALDDWQRAGRAGSAPLLGLRKPQLAREKANVLSAEAELEKAKRNLARTVIRAPYNAIVSKRQIDIGQFVSMGTVVGEVLATDIAQIRLPISTAEYATLGIEANNKRRHTSTSESHEELASVELMVNQGEHNWTRSAQLVRDEGIVNNQNRQIYLVTQVVDPYALSDTDNKALRFGQFVKAKIYGPEIANVATIPLSALYRNQFVYVVSDGVLLKRTVTIVDRDDDYIMVTEGLDNGDKVMTTKLSLPVSGMAVKIANAASETRVTEQGANND